MGDRLNKLNEKLRNEPNPVVDLRFHDLRSQIAPGRLDNHFGLRISFGPRTSVSDFTREITKRTQHYKQLTMIAISISLTPVFRVEITRNRKVGGPNGREFSQTPSCLKNVPP